MPSLRPGRLSKKQRAFVSPAAHSEAFRILRSNLDVALIDVDRPVLAVTSANPGEGKTATTVNLTRAMAAVGRRVVLVDLDLRHPDTHNLLGVSNEGGVSDVLLERRSLSESLRYLPLATAGAVTPSLDGVNGSRGRGAKKTRSERTSSNGTGAAAGSNGTANAGGFYFLSTGPQVANPAELLDSPRLGQLLDMLSRQADLVVVDTPPMLPVADTLIITRRTSGALLVVETRKTNVGAIQQAKSALTRNQTPLFGVVVNKLQPRDSGLAEGYGYGYGAPVDPAAAHLGAPAPT